MTLVALSAAYGAGGSRVGPALAERLGVPFVDRAIPLAVADRLEVPLDAAEAHDETVGGSWIERLVSGFIGHDTVAPTPVPAERLSPNDFRIATEEVLLSQARTGAGVILGRAAVVVLRDDSRALRVRLDGPREQRVRQAVKLGDLDRETAERAIDRADRTHAAYVRHFYGVSLDDPTLYHMMLDSTAISLEAVVELIAVAARSLAGTIP
jgi:cytidylate kinase